MDRIQANYEFARKYLVAGVSASTRVNRAFDRPVYFARGDRGRVWDLNGKEYVDLCTSHGAALLGHNHPKIRQAVERALDMGVICAYETEDHGRLAQKIVEMIPCAELVRFTGSGTETTMHCIRLARTFTGKSKIVRFEGHYHGLHDYLHIGGRPPIDKAGPVEAPTPYIESAGVPEGMKDYVIPLPFNDLDAVERTVQKQKDEIAAIILEPVNYNAGCILPKKGYLEGLRQLTRDHGILLIFDEILSGFRTGPGCAQAYYGVTPDLCTLGKALGGGLPISAFCGQREIMEHIAPLGRSAHSGTYNGHLVNVTAALAALEEIASPGFYDPIFAMADRLYAGFTDAFRRTGVKGHIQGLGARFGIFFGIEEEVTNYRQSEQHDRGMMLRFIRETAQRGVYFHDYGGIAVHHGFSSAHTTEDIDQALEGIEGALKAMA
ncbi:MAG: aminotransferase class III-fold pyridoxal phosphate-dependent enzyme [Candidatus Latescibacteria bacterium]|nr:aminotransferase class III-fold pyridoxal phosphate-dependent enzyme [Candidatus Latescibacterota bacterium]